MLPCIKDQNAEVDFDNRINLLGYIDYEYNIEKYWAKYIESASFM